jgi:hypothetical protein
LFAVVCRRFAVGLPSTAFNSRYWLPLEAKIRNHLTPTISLANATNFGNSVPVTDVMFRSSASMAMMR